MKKLLFFLVTILIAFVSCDRRERIHKTNAEILKGNQLLESYSETVKFFPERYTQVSKDTILSNGYTVKIKSSSDMQNSYLKTFAVNTITNKHYYREVISEVTIYKENKEIFKEIINDDFLVINTKDYISRELYIDEQKSLKTNKIHLIATLCIPQTINCPTYSIIIDDNGNYEINRT